MNPDISLGQLVWSALVVGVSIGALTTSSVMMWRTLTVIQHNMLTKQDIEELLTAFRRDYWSELERRYPAAQYGK